LTNWNRKDRNFVISVFMIFGIIVIYQKNLL